MKNILIPTDFSPNSWNAVVYAMQFLKDENCKFYFLHTYTPSFYRLDYMIGGPEFSAIPDYEVDVSVEGLEKTVQDVKKQFPNKKHSYKTVSAFNTLTDEINAFSKRKNIDMVVMGTQGATGAEQLFLGSSTVFVIRKAKVPVLAVPKNCRFTGVKNMLFPTDYWPQYKKEEVQTIIDLAIMHKAEITLLHINDGYDLTEEQVANRSVLEDELQRVPHNEIEMIGKSMPDAILEYIDEHHIDLLTMMNRGHSFFDRILIKQNIDQIGFHVHIPFLVVRDTAEIKKK